jgi:hypothetical protein
MENKVTREVLGYLPSTTHPLYVNISTYYQIDDYAPGDLENAFREKLAQDGFNFKQTQVPHVETYPVVALARVKYVEVTDGEQGPDWIRVEPLRAYDISSDGSPDDDGCEVPGLEEDALRHNLYWQLFADLKSAEEEAESINITHNLMRETAGLIRSQYK